MSSQPQFQLRVTWTSAKQGKLKLLRTLPQLRLQDVPKLAASSTAYAPGPKTAQPALKKQIWNLAMESQQLVRFGGRAKIWT